MTKYAEQSALNLIAGEAVTGKEEWEIRNPAKTSQVVGQVSVATFEQVDDAAQAAAKAAPEWAAVPVAERVAIASAAAVIIEQKAGELGWDVLLTREQGKILPEAVVEFAFAQIEAQYINT
ncbi:aldehyde dehydrogenase family protein, partial [Mycobacterium sp.]|uniref:aldehyde dehydrogenase family protein n=1 Tax=Mycobacterium sp. TaxID=1785 RepID=UPI003BAE560B